MSAAPRILFEDNHLLAVEKAPGVLAQADASGAPDMLSILKRFIKERDAKPGNVFLGLVHRLDRNVGGAMIFAKTSKAAARLSEQIRERTIVKIYLALVAGRPEPASARLEHDLAKDARLNTSRVVSRDRAEDRTAPGVDSRGAHHAVLDYETLASRDELSLLRVRIITGRSHQIRVQLAAIGHPIAGDRKYALTPTARAAGDLALWSAEIRFRHPTRDEEIVVRAAPPSRGVWAAFPEAIATLR
ncbi:MAG: RluA family pseudouridine synthase [bacterium]